jgi:zinc finger RNA-binding protein
VKIIRDITQRVRTWIPLNTWAIELLVEKALASIGMALSPGDAVRRVFELMSSGVYLSGEFNLELCQKFGKLSRTFKTD